MVIASLILSIVSIVVCGVCLIVMLSAIGTVQPLILDKINNKNSDPNDPYNEDYMRGYNDSGQSLITSMELALYDMGQNLEILNFEEEFHTLIQRMDKISSDTEFRRELTEKYIEYKNEVNDGNGFNNF